MSERERAFLIGGFTSAFAIMTPNTFLGLLAVVLITFVGLAFEEFVNGDE